MNMKEFRNPYLATRVINSYVKTLVVGGDHCYKLILPLALNIFPQDKGNIFFRTPVWNLVWEEPSSPTSRMLQPIAMTYPIYIDTESILIEKDYIIYHGRLQGVSEQTIRNYILP